MAPRQMIGPYAPTPKGRAAERAARRKIRRRRPEVAGPYRSQSSNPKIRSKATRHEHRHPAPPPSPPKRAPSRPQPAPRHVPAEPSRPKLRRHEPRPPSTPHPKLEHRALSKLKETLERNPEVVPPKVLEHTHPHLYKWAQLNHITRGLHENIESDPIAEAVISTAATAGLSAAGKAVGLAGKAGVEAISSKLASKEAGAGAEAASRGAKALTGKATRAAERGVSKRIDRVRTAPQRAASGVRNAPRRIREAPGKAKTAASTPAGRRAAARATARSARHHPVRTSYGATVALPPGVLPGDATKRARAFAEGSANAILHHPIETAQTTGRSLSGAVTGPAALLEAAGLSAIHGDPRYLTKTAAGQAKGTAHIVSQAFSGNAKTAEKAARKEGSLALVTPLPAVTRLKAYERGRGVLRRTAGDVRRNVAARSEKLNRRVRHAPPGVEQHVFGHAARHDFRKTTALIKQRTDNSFRMGRHHHREQVTKHMAKAPRGSDVAFQTAAEYGIRDPRMAALVRAKGPGDPHLIRALDYMDAHPHLWHDKSFKAALKAADKNGKALPAALVGKGERARLMQQGDVFGHTRPEHMVPPRARKLTVATDREGAWKDLELMEGQAKAIRRRGRDKLVEARPLKGTPRATKLKGQTKLLYANARRLERHSAALRKELDPFTRPGQAIDRSTRQPFNKAMLSEYKGKVEASRVAHGAAPAIYTHHAAAPGHGDGLENPFPTPAGRVEHMREGRLASEGKLDRGLEAYVKGTVDLPRMRESGRKFMRALVDHYKTPFTIGGKKKLVGQGSADWVAITARRDAAHPNGGQIDPKSWGRLAYREWKNALTDPYMSSAERQAKLTSLLADAEEGKIKGSEPWVLIPREAIKEARLQITPEHSAIVKALNVGGRVANRGILATNPAWEVAQTVAEGIPIILAHPEALLKAPAILRDIHRYHRDNPEGAIALEATAGAAPISSAALRTPLDMQETYTPALWDEGGKELTRGRSAKEVLSFAKLRTLGRIDAKRQNTYRTVTYALEADKRFRSFHSGLTSLFDSQRRLSQNFRGKSRQELWNWLEHDPKGQIEKAKLERYVDDVAGNWTAFTHFERTYAPLAIFYGFLRYSLRWTLWTFPKTHPITATIAYMLGQTNANQIEKLAGGKPTNPLAYAYPVYTTPSGKKSVLPGGSRISPGQSPLTQVLATGQPGQVVSSANPFIAAGYTALSGQEPLSGEKSTLPRGYAALKQLMAMPAPVRIKAPDGTPIIGGESISQKILEALGAPERSGASKAYERFDPNRSLRSIALPMLPQSAGKFHDSERFSRELDTKNGKGHVPGPFDSPLVQDLLYGGPGGTPQPKLLPKVLAEIHKAEAAGGVVKSAESAFYPKGKPFSNLQSKLLQAVEDAWKTGPGSKGKLRRSQGGIGGTAGGGIGGTPLGSIGGSAGGGIGGHPIGGSIGG